MPYAPGVATVATAVEIRDVRGPAELRACQALQRQVWGITEDGYLLPVATMAAAQRVGGSVLGAFDADDRLLGFAFAFLGRLADRDILYSQLAAVHPDVQGRGIGRQLKLEHVAERKRWASKPWSGRLTHCRLATRFSTWACSARHARSTKSTCMARAATR